MVEKVSGSKKQRNNTRMLALLLACCIVGLYIALSFLPLQMDWTSDKRYSITPATENLLKSLDRPVKITVFLTGEELPAAFKRLEQSTASLLGDFRRLSRNKISYQFVDPLGNEDALTALNERRMSGLPITVSAGKKGTMQKMVFPWALVQTPEGGDFPVFLQESNTPELSRTILNKSEMLLEYNLANAIHQLAKEKQFSIAYLTGNGEPFDMSISAAMSALLRFYTVDTVNLQGVKEIPLTYDAVIVNRPLDSFTTIDKLKLDQYLLKGKSLFFAIDAVTGSLDDFDERGSFNSLPVEIGMNDFFFNLGFRINANVIEDAVSSAGIPLATGDERAAPTIYPWVYFPVLQSAGDHPIVKNLSGVLGRFVSSIDVNTSNPEVVKTPLLVSSNYSRTTASPQPIVLESAIVEKNPAEFTSKNIVAALLAEGSFQSLYAGRQPGELRAYLQEHRITPLKQSSKPGKVIVVSDGQMIANEFSEQSGPTDMGVYRFSDYRFDNKSFFLNAIEYLTDEDHLLEARTKSFQTRLLDPKRLNKERFQWQLINVGVPSAFVVLFGVVYFYIRKRRYGSANEP